MGTLATAIIGAGILALVASVLITRAARYSPVVNILLGALTVMVAFGLLLLIFAALARTTLG